MRGCVVSVIASAMVLLLSAVSNGHGGGLDSSGGHHNRKSGGYHYHRQGGSAPKPRRVTRGFAGVRPLTGIRPVRPKPRPLRETSARVVPSRVRLSPRLSNPRQQKPDSRERIEAYFSPATDCASIAAAEIAKTKKRVRVQADSLGSSVINAALIEALKREVGVIAVLNRSAKNAGDESAAELTAAGAYVGLDAEHAMGANVTILIDDDVIVTGGFGSKGYGLQVHAETMLVIRGNHSIFQQFSKAFASHLKHAPNKVK